MYSSDCRLFCFSCRDASSSVFPQPSACSRRRSARVHLELGAFCGQRHHAWLSRDGRGLRRKFRGRSAVAHDLPFYLRFFQPGGRKFLRQLRTSSNFYRRHAVVCRSQRRRRLQSVTMGSIRLEAFARHRCGCRSSRHASDRTRQLERTGSGQRQRNDRFFLCCGACTRSRRRRPNRHALRLARRVSFPDGLFAVDCVLHLLPHSGDAKRRRPLCL